MFSPKGAKNLKTAMASHIDSSNASLVSCGIIGDVTSKFMVHRQGAINTFALTYNPISYFLSNN